MKNLKKTLALVLALVLAIGLLAGCGGSSNEEAATDNSGSGDAAASEGEYTMVIAAGMSSDYFICRAYQEMADYIEEKSDGRIKVNTFFESQLTGDDQTTAEMLSNGTMTFGEADMSIFAQYINNPDMLFTTIPYFLSPDGEAGPWQYFIDNSELMKNFYEQIEQASGIRLETVFDNGTMSIMYNGDPLGDNLDALQGKKVRAADKDSDLNALKALGINATPLAFTEIYTSLQQGVIDGVFTGSPLLADYKFGEQCNQYIDLGVWPLVYVNAMNAAWYDALPADLQAVVDEGVQLCTEKQRTYAAEYMETVYDEISATGCNVQFPSDALRALTLEKFEPYIQERLDALTPEFKDALLAEKDKLYAEYEAQN